MSRMSQTACGMAGCERSKVLIICEPNGNSPGTNAELAPLIYRSALADGWATVDGKMTCPACVRVWITETALRDLPHEREQVRRVLAERDRARRTIEVRG